MCLKAHWFSASICTESQNAISPTVLPPSNLPHPGYHQTHLHDHNKNLPDHHNPAHTLPRSVMFMYFSFIPLYGSSFFLILSSSSFSFCAIYFLYCSSVSFWAFLISSIYLLLYSSPFGTYHISLCSSSIPSPF